MKKAPPSPAGPDFPQSDRESGQFSFVPIWAMA